MALFYTRLTHFYRLGHPPLFYSGVFPTAVINYFALYSEAGSLPRLKLRTAYAFFPHNQASGFSSEEDPPLYGSAFQASPTRGAAERAESPGERTDRAGLCKAHKARFCELERNPRQPTVSSSCRRDGNRAVQGRVPFRVESAASGGKIKKYLAKSTA